MRLGYPVLNDCLQSAEADVSGAEEDQPIHRVEERRLRQPCTGTAAVRTEAGSGTSTVVSCSEKGRMALESDHTTPRCPQGRHTR